MLMIHRTSRRVNAWAVALLASGVLASCAELPSSQQPVQSSNPSVTYNYRTDQELLQANQNATAYCSQYQTSPRTANITNNSDGSKAVVFECVRTAFLAPAPAPASPNLTYTYRTDQELVQASQTASAYCQKYGTQPMSSTMVTNPNGSRTVTFQCGLR
jgi:exopolysaccharide biosynthesis predicted pyruvyltransferase EpsI